MIARLERVRTISHNFDMASAMTWMNCWQNTSATN
jgi:hypothetical protein